MIAIRNVLSQQWSAQRRSNPFSRVGSPVAPATTGSRPKSALFSSPSPSSDVAISPSHGRPQSIQSLNTLPTPVHPSSNHQRNQSRNGTPSSSTFAPSFIKTEDDRRSHEAVKGIEGENDFSGKRYVWLKDPQNGFVKGWVVEDLPNNRLLVQCDDGSVSPCLERLLFRTALTMHSNEKPMLKASIKSTLLSSTRQTIWPN